VNGPYEFLAYLRQLQQSFSRFETLVFALNAIIISAVLYAVLAFLGLPAFTNFYWQDFFLLAQLPAIISLAIGIVISVLMKRRSKEDFYAIFDKDLSEEARTAYDNRDSRSVFMDHLAEDLKRKLASIKASSLLDWRKVYIRAGLAAIVLLLIVIITTSEISADLSPADLQTFSHLKDSATGLFQDENQPQGPSANLTGGIYGKPSLAILSEEKLSLQLYPGLAPGSKSQETSLTNHLFQPGEAGEAAAVPSDVYIESLPPQNKEIIKRYFENLAKS
jgi:hypothetical protein